MIARSSVVVGELLLLGLLACGSSGDGEGGGGGGATGPASGSASTTSTGPVTSGSPTVSGSGGDPGQGGHGAAGGGGSGQGGIEEVPYVCGLAPQPLCGTLLREDMPEIPKLCFSQRCCAEMEDCVEDPACLVDGFIEVQSPTGAALLECLELKCGDYSQSDAVDNHVCDAGMLFLVSGDSALQFVSRSACIARSCCDTIAGCAEPDADACYSCLNAGDDRCADARACILDTCSPAICDSGLETEDVIFSQCVAGACCEELRDCTQGGTDPEACVACFDACGGPLCDAAIACVDAAGCVGWTPDLHDAAID